MQNNLGPTLLRLGKKESGTERLWEAVAAYSAALEELTREWAPFDWAMTQNNLGNIFIIIGKRKKRSDCIQYGITCYRFCLEEWRPDEEPYWSRMVSDNLKLAMQEMIRLRLT